MGYELVLVIPVIIFIGLVIIHYQKKMWKKYMYLTFTALAVSFYMFIHPGIFGIKKKFPYIYWAGYNKTKIGKGFDLSIRKIFEKMGFTFPD